MTVWNSIAGGLAVLLITRYVEFSSEMIVLISLPSICKKRFRKTIIPEGLKRMHQSAPRHIIIFIWGIGWQ